jgi:uncharacterized membrane protein YhaH (DUF805 family)
MGTRLSDFWRFEGTVNRRTYALIGFIGFALKHNLDRLIASSLGFRWGIWNYRIPFEDLTRPANLLAQDRKLIYLLLLTALPFIWIGLTMTAKRLRDAGQPLWLTVLFFAPMVNLLFFAILCVLPSRAGTAEVARDGGIPQTARGFWPDSRTGSAALGASVAALIGIAVTWIDLRLLGNYGLTLFVAAPFAMGYIAMWVHGHRVKRGLKDLFAVVSLTVALAMTGIVAIAAEGVICVLMAAPLAWILALIGGAVALVVHNRAAMPHPEPQTFAVLLVALPVLFGAEHLAPPPVPRFQVRTSIEIAAPPEIVWQRIVSFPTLPPPRELPFRVGIAYPVEARLRGEGLTADRECRFSTGSFKEPILAWEPNKHFAFSISEEPLLMKETSLYGNIRVRHLEDHDLQPERADIFLTPLPNGGTRLEGIGTYTNKMWPGFYWRIWADSIVHSIHHRVFEQVKELAEADARTMQTAKLTN